MDAKLDIYITDSQGCEKNFQENIDFLIKESINGYGCIFWKKSLEELLNALISEYGKELNNFHEQAR